MRANTLTWIVPGIAVLAMCLAEAAAQPRFHGIGLPPGSSYSGASSISRDGRVVVGNGREGTSGPMIPFRWTEEGGIIPLPRSLSSNNSTAFALSADGSTVVGYERPLACRWVGAAPPSFISTAAESGTGAPAYGVSADGTWIVGMANDLVFRWSEATGLLRLGDVRGPSYFNLAYGVSDDGSVVVGRAYLNGTHNAFRWTQGGGFESIVVGNNSVQPPFAIAVSADGSVVCGGAASPAGREAFRWTAAGGVEFLGDLPGGTVSSYANAMTADGETIVGGAVSAEGSRPFIWTRERGMRDLRQVLTDDFGVDLTGWVLSYVNGISGDGRVLCGSGVHNGVSEGWVVYLPSTCNLETTREPIDRTVHPDVSFTLSTNVAGLRPVTYQWRRNGQPLTDGPGFSGTSTSELTISNLASSDTFDVTTTNACGTVVSRTARVTVVPSTTPIVTYVDANATGANDGLSWASAFTSLQAAIDVSSSNTQLWVAEGSYGNNASIVLRSNISIYGGFAGTETALSQRDPAAHPTIIDGQNAVRCVNATNCTNTRMDGFTITRGNPGAAAAGGGIFVSGGNPIIANCVLRANAAPNSSSGSSIRGAGIYVTGDATVQLIDSEISQNQAGYATTSPGAAGQGGGVAVVGASLSMIRCVVANNSAAVGFNSDCGGGQPFGGGPGDHGGGIRLDNATLTLDRCELRGNRAPAGGSGAGCSWGGSANGGFRGGSGGALYATNSIVNAGNTLFINNSAGNGGSAGTSWFGTPVGSSGNGGSGGAIYASGGSVALHNCTIAGNSAGRGGSGTNGGGDAAPGAGGGVFVSGATLSISNSILWDNIGYGSALANQVSPTNQTGILWSCVQGIVPAPGSGNLEVDPRFVSVSDRSLLRGSPCIDAGNNSYVLKPRDLAGNLRRVDVLGVFDTGVGPGPIADLGAYEASYCIADLDDGSGLGVSDGAVTIDDLLFFLVSFEDGQPAADVDNGLSSGRTDGGVTVDDLLYFLMRLEAGC